MKKPIIQVKSNAVDRVAFVNGKLKNIYDMIDINDKMMDDLISIYHSIENSKSNSGAVYLGDRLELRIKETLIEVGCKFEH